jgi:hypothetical protein
MIGDVSNMNMIEEFEHTMRTGRRPRRERYDPSKQTCILCGPAEYPNIVVYSKSYVYFDRQDFQSPTDTRSVPPKHTVICFDPPMKLEANEAVKIIVNSSGLLSVRRIKKPYVKKSK